MQHPPYSFKRSVTLLLIVLLPLCYAVQWFVVERMGKPYDAYLALSAYGMKSFHLWEIWTYQFLELPSNDFGPALARHAGVIHLLITLIGLWFIGKSVEASIGRNRFILIYLGAVIAGGVLQGLVGVTGFIIPESHDDIAAFFRDRYGGPCYGASVGLLALFAAYCRLKCDRKIFTALLWMAIAAAIVLVILPTNPLLPHLSHLVALIAAALLTRSGFRQRVGADTPASQ